MPGGDGYRDTPRVDDANTGRPGTGLPPTAALGASDLQTAGEKRGIIPCGRVRLPRYGFICRVGFFPSYEGTKVRRYVPKVVIFTRMYCFSNNLVKWFTVKVRTYLHYSNLRSYTYLIRHSRSYTTPTSKM